MKKLTLLLLTLISLLLIIGCSTQSMVNYELNPNLPKLNSVKAIVSSTSVGFEWKPLKGLDGVNIYRTDANKYQGSATKQLTKIATVTNPFATHFVDTGLKQGSAYTYTFRTIKGIYESDNGKIINIKTDPALPPVSFFQGVQKAKNVIKLIWRPHPDKRVKMYRIEKSINGENWKWVKFINSRIMVEYIDTYIVTGSKHQYRITALGFDGSYSKPSKVVTIIAK